jgi:hypothetical protein
MARRKLLDWERDAIVMAMASGEKREAICAEFHVCMSYPTVLARRRGIPSRGIGRPKKLQLDKTVLAT